MKLNWAERLVVNNPLRVVQQRIELYWMRQKVSLRPGSFALEIGCGRGACAGLILEKFSPSVFHAMDLDIQMILKAKNKLSISHKTKTFLYVGDVVTLPYKSSSIDAIIGFGVLHHVLFWDNALAEISRVLKTGGIYFFEELYPALYQNIITRHILLHPRQNRFNGYELKTGMKDAGLILKNALEFKNLGIVGISIKMKS
jgi:ubiquinone/menaquinone biosynthesis C-methylase UbiE